MDFKPLETQAESNKLKDAFLTTISHEMRTPMNGVLGAMELIKANKLDTQLRENIDIAVTSAEKMITLVDRVLDFAQLQSGMSEIANRPFDLHQALRHTCQPFEIECNQRGLTLTTDFDDVRDKIAIGDMDKIISIIRILLDNAVKFSDSGEIHCYIHLDETGTNTINDNKSQRIKISITDNGIGIDPKFHNTIFEAFHQIDASFHRNHEGLGIGLSTAKALASLLGTTIDVTSTLNHGSTFSFIVDLPIQDRVANNTADNQPVKDREKANILIVEDNKTNQLILSKIVTKLGYHADHADNGQEAVNFANNNHIDLILMDCQMPIMDGFDATQCIRESNGINKDAPIIAVTANITDQDKKKVFESGMNELVAKPVNMKRIQTSIETWLGAATIE